MISHRKPPWVGTQLQLPPSFNCRLVVSLLLPGSFEVEDWLLLARQKRNMWPMQMTSHTVPNNLPTEQFMRRERRQLKARHIWVALKPEWIKLRLFTRHVTKLGWDVLHERSINMAVSNGSLKMNIWDLTVKR